MNRDCIIDNAILWIIFHSLEINRVCLVSLSVEGAFDAKLEFLHHLLATTFLDRIVLHLSNDSLDILGESDVEEDGAA